jgi:formylglycine-generating enzyme required for sulfatase activity
MYPWGERFNMEYCNLYKGENSKIEPVYSHKENHSPYECCGQIGNVMEWVSESDSDTEILVRGSSYWQSDIRAYCSAIFEVSSKEGSHQIGFRTMIIIQ